MLQVNEILRRQCAVKIGNLVRNPLHFILINPDAIVAPIDGKFIRKHAVCIDEYRNPTAAQGLIESIGEIPGSSCAQNEITIDKVLDEFQPSHLHPVKIYSSIRSQSSPEKAISDNEIGLYCRAVCQSTQGPSPNGSTN